jgi:hypothetical protein
MNMPVGATNLYSNRGLAQEFSYRLAANVRRANNRQQEDTVRRAQEQAATQTVEQRQRIQVDLRRQDQVRSGADQRGVTRVDDRGDGRRAGRVTYTPTPSQVVAPVGEQFKTLQDARWDGARRDQLVTELKQAAEAYARVAKASSDVFRRAEGRDTSPTALERANQNVEQVAENMRPLPKVKVEEKPRLDLWL